jgi:hypothetical protein
VVAGKLASGVELRYLARAIVPRRRLPMSERPARTVPFAAASLALLLAACGGGSSTTPPQPPCPTVLFLKGAERTADYRPGPSSRPGDLRHLAVLTDLVSLCRYEGGGADVALRFDLVAEQGPAYGGGPLRLTYFVASLGPDRQVLSKPLFEVEIAFPEGQQRAGSTEEMTVHMPGVTEASGSRYSIFVGFQLDDAEMRRRLEREQT